MSDSSEINAFIDVDNPVFGEASSDMPKKVLNNCKENGQEVPKSIGEIARCIYQSMVMKFKVNFTLLEDVVDNKIEVLHLTGGGIYNKSLCQWTADAIGIPVLAGPAETTSIGNLLMQLKYSGEISTLEDGRTLSRNSSKTHLYPSEDRDKWGKAYPEYLKLLEMQ